MATKAKKGKKEKAAKAEKSASSSESTTEAKSSSSKKLTGAQEKARDRLLDELGSVLHKSDVTVAAGEENGKKGSVVTVKREGGLKRSAFVPG